MRADPDVLDLLQRGLLQLWEFAAFSAGWLAGRRMFLLSRSTSAACFLPWSVILPLPAEMAGGRVPRPSLFITHISALVFILCLAGEFDFLRMSLKTVAGLRNKVSPTPNFKIWFEIEHWSKGSWLVCLGTAALVLHNCELVVKMHNMTFRRLSVLKSRLCQQISCCSFSIVFFQLSHCNANTGYDISPDI